MGIGIGIGLIALSFIFLATDEADLVQDESTIGVELSDNVTIVVEESKSFEVNISEELEVGDENP